MKALKSLNKPVPPRTKEDVTKDYKELATQFGNMIFAFEIQRQEHLKKFAQLTKEMELVSALEESSAGKRESKSPKEIL